MRPTVAEVHLRTLQANYGLLRERARAYGAELLGVVKANAYGHGVELCGPALARAGAAWLGVTSVEEGLRLRRALGALRPRVLLMSGVFRGEGALVRRQELTPVVWEPWHIEELPPGARVHVEIDSGMSRQGVAAGTALHRLLRATAGRVRIEGVLTHFSSPEMRAQPMMAAQMERFEAAAAQVMEAGARLEWMHAGNSANAWTGDQLQRLRALAERAGARAMVRPGLALYGVSLRFDSALEMTGLQPVMRWRTEVVGVREAPAGTAVGYNETFVAPPGGAKLALLPVGYADGYRRELSNCGEVLVRGCRARVAGRVSMDQTVVDVSRVPGVRVGDEVELLGAEITAREVADWCGTIPYEVLCGVGERVRRVGVEAVRCLSSAEPRDLRVVPD